MARRIFQSTLDMRTKKAIHISPARVKTAHRFIVRLCLACLCCTVTQSLKSHGTDAGKQPGSARSAASYTARSKVDQSGLHRALYNVRSAPYAGTPEQAARSFLNENRGLLRIQSTDAELLADRVDAVPGGTHVRFIQTVGQIPVYRGDVVVSLDAENRVGMVVNNSHPGLTLPATLPAFDAGRAIDQTRGLLQAAGRPVGRPPAAELMAFRDDDGTAHLVYRVTMVLEDPAGDWEVLVDALTGEELKREDRFVNQTDGRASVSGSGYVYLGTPLGKSRQFYGTPGFVDADDADSDSLTAYRTLVRLDSIMVDQGGFSLTGPWVTITDIESPSDPPSYSEATADGFRYTRSQPGFEAVMAYYHASIAYARLRQLGFSSPTLTRLMIDPHGYQGRDNSHYSPSGNWISFGTGGVDDAEDAEVIWHEYGHAIHYNIDPMWGGGECGSLGEGLGDYWAASYSRSLREWEPDDAQYNWLFVWDGHNPFWSGRITNDSRSYPFGDLSVHAAGQIWAATLLGIRGDLGRDVTDRLVIKSLFYLGSDVTAVDHAQALLQADRDLYAGEHIPTLLYWLSTVKNFIPAGDSAPILIVSDDSPGEMDDAGQRVSSAVSSIASSRWSSHDVLSAVQPPEGFGFHRATMGDLDTAVLRRYAAVILLGGTNENPFDRDDLRSALVDYVQQGGKILAEGGQAGYVYRRNSAAGEKDCLFRTEVLGSDLYVSDAPSSSLIVPGEVQKTLEGGGAFFTTPHVLPTPITFAGTGETPIRDAVTASFGTHGTIVLGGWSTEPGGRAIIARTGSDGSIRSLFMPFAVGLVADSGAAVKLVENALAYLLFHLPATTEFAQEQPAGPESFALLQNFPNPFNPSTTISFNISEGSAVSVEVFSLLGQRIRTLVEGSMSAGRQSVTWDGRSDTGIPVSSGTYILRMESRPLSESASSGRLIQTRRMMLLR